MTCTFLNHHINTFVIRAVSNDFESRDIYNIESTLESGTLIKDDKSTRIIYLHKPAFNRPVIVKKFKFKGCLHSILRSLSVSRAKNYWRGAHALAEIGIITPKPLALIEKKLGPVMTESYIITEFYAGQNAKQLIDTPGKYSKETIEWFANEATTILSALFQNRITHGDTKLPNFMIKDSEVCVIDLDVMRIHPSKSDIRKYIKQDIERFERDWKNHPYKDTIFEKTQKLRNTFLVDEK